MAAPAAQLARHAALDRLRIAHPDEFAKYYDEERVARGLKPVAGRREARIEKLKAELARLGVTVDA